MVGRFVMVLKGGVGGLRRLGQGCKRAGRFGAAGAVVCYASV